MPHQRRRALQLSQHNGCLKLETQIDIPEEAHVKLICFMLLFGYTVSWVKSAIGILTSANCIRGICEHGCAPKVEAILCTKKYDTLKYIKFYGFSLK